MRRRTGLFLLVVVVGATGACSVADDSAGTAASNPPATSPEIATDFCDAWDAARRSGDDSALLPVLAEAPPELEAAAAIVRENDVSGSDPPEAEAAFDEIRNWTELNRDWGEPGDSPRRVAPPVDTEFDELTFCGTTDFPSTPDDGRSGMVLYGQAAADDPYDGPMLGLLWNDADDGGHRGDGDSESVTVRGQRGVAAPITVFQQVILPELGTVIAWTEGERAVGLYGRHWSMAQANELVAIADRIEEVDGRLRLPDDALPEGYGEVFSGRPLDSSIVLPLSSLYILHYRDGDGGLYVRGLQMTEQEFEAFRFLTTDVDQGEVAGREGLVGNAWHEDGPAVVTWREPDGLVVRIVGIGVPMEVALEVARATRELDADQWAALVEADDRCEDPLVD